MSCRRFKIQKLVRALVRALAVEVSHERRVKAGEDAAGCRVVEVGAHPGVRRSVEEFDEVGRLEVDVLVVLVAALVLDVEKAGSVVDETESDEVVAAVFGRVAVGVAAFAAPAALIRGRRQVDAVGVRVRVVVERIGAVVDALDVLVDEVVLDKRGLPRFAASREDGTAVRFGFGKEQRHEGAAVEVVVAPVVVVVAPVEVVAGKRAGQLKKRGREVDVCDYPRGLRVRRDAGASHD
mmetsp:Transcript_11535/g.34516  ORF Transcript_11535/g.34516 Transcript_11535/m.34516 type:complete len:237 (-) Transcript_11535:984-1694(-)